jgi:hypothetical protein
VTFSVWVRCEEGGRGLGSPAVHLTVDLEGICWVIHADAALLQRAPPGAPAWPWLRPTLPPVYASLWTRSRSSPFSTGLLSFCFFVEGFFLLFHSLTFDFTTHL